MKQDVEDVTSTGNDLKRNQAQSKRSTATWVAVAGLTAFSVGVLLVMALDGRVDLPGVLFASAPLVLAGLVLTGNRWLILVVALVTALAFVFGIQAPMVKDRLAHPEQLGYFIVAALEMLGSALATVAGLIAFVQTIVGRPRSLNRSSRPGSAESRR